MKLQQRGIYLTVMYFTAIILLSNLANAQEKRKAIKEVPYTSLISKT